MSEPVLRPVLRRWWAAVTLGGLLLGPTAVDAQAPVATVVIYEVAEALRFKGPNAATSPVEFRRRLAEATLLGKDIQGRPGTIFGGAQFIIVDARSNVDLNTGVGPIRGTFDLLLDTDPSRESLDTLVITGSGSLRGTLDLSTAQQGYAGVRGRWEAHRARARGTFQGAFLIPFRVMDTYYYLDLGLSPCPDGARLPVGPGNSLVPACPLRADEFSLGIPLTKAVIFLHSD